MSAQRIAALFIALQALKNEAWRAHIARRHAEATQIAGALAAAAEELKTLLSNVIVS